RRNAGPQISSSGLGRPSVGRVGGVRDPRPTVLRRRRGRRSELVFCPFKDGRVRIVYASLRESVALNLQLEGQLLSNHVGSCSIFDRLRVGVPFQCESSANGPINLTGDGAGTDDTPAIARNKFEATAIL